MLWLRTVLSAGTLGDKVAALTLLVQESPVHTLVSLDSLLAMASKKGKRESILATGTPIECQTNHHTAALGPLFGGPSLAYSTSFPQNLLIILSMAVSDALKELWISELLPEDRKLKSLKLVSTAFSLHYYSSEVSCAFS